MELKSYEKPWLPAFKGAFLIIFGIVALLRIVGSIKALSILFVVLISALAILLISSAVLFKKSDSKAWSIISGLLNLFFSIFLLIKMNSPAKVHMMLILAWVIFYAIAEIIEAGILLSKNNAFSALFLLNAILTLLFGYFFYVVINNFTIQGVFYIGLIAFVFGITNVLSSYLLSRIK
jgi:uncharacterized membrane protein HdeD (DUF308 family)